MRPVLNILSSPIGNLGDITLRGIEVLKNCDTVIAEDTRVTAKLLSYYSINKPMFSVRERSDIAVVKGLVNKLASGALGESVVYVTDAGTPGVSDPGNRLVAFAREGGVDIVPLPGPSALTTIMQISGENLSDGVLFLGFLPKKKGRKTLFEKMAHYPLPVVVFESKYRLIKTLTDFRNIWGSDCRVIIGRELTKKFEQIIAGSVVDAIELCAQSGLKGEFTLLIVPS